jgi:pyrroloquinoline-quinone synthase
VDFFTRLDALRERWNVLEHPFYQRWSAGELSRDELAFYAGEYRHAVVALADGLTAAAATAEPAIKGQLDEHAAEEREHVALWDVFAGALDADLDRAPRPETADCVTAWTAGADTLEGLVAAYVVESGQPEVAKTKLDGLIERYAFVDEGPATEYFALHSDRDHEHAAQSRALIEERLVDADADRLLDVAEGVLKGNWELLDGVDRASATA